MTREELTLIYEQSLENQPHAGPDVTQASSDLDEAINAYTTALQYETFLWAYELGFNAGRRVNS